jgi:hypothetical protein
MTPPFEFDVFHGRLAPHLAHVYARVASLPGGGPWTLSGRIRGPDCLVAKTLPVTAAFVDAGPGPTLLAKATLTDPCFWTSELPFVYRVTIELRRAGELITTHEQLFGMRFLGCRQSFFYWENRRWVLRGVFRESAIDAPLSAWREFATAMLVSEPDDELCAEASRQGVVLVASAQSNVGIPGLIRRLSKWPAVTMVLIQSPLQSGDEVQNLSPNLLLGTASDEFSLVQLPRWSQVVFIDSRSAAAAKRAGEARPIALLAYRKLSAPLPLEHARAACDDLQRDVVSIGDFAGYVV